jgi:hypothetical protein
MNIVSTKMDLLSNMIGISGSEASGSVSSRLLAYPRAKKTRFGMEEHSVVSLTDQKLRYSSSDFGLEVLQNVRICQLH